jgi:MYXO-CTERM domain-containing protein
LTDDGCQACLETSCCSELQDCSADVECLDCLGTIAPSGCYTDPETQSLQACADANCPTECNFNFNPPTSGTGVGGGAGVGGVGSTGVGAGGFGGDPSSGAGNPDDGDPTVIEGCGCRTAGRPSSTGWWALALAALGVAAERRRRR